MDPEIRVWHYDDTHENGPKPGGWIASYAKRSLSSHGRTREQAIAELERLLQVVPLHGTELSPVELSMYP